MNLGFILVFLSVTLFLVCAVYDHRPGEKYQTFLPQLNSGQLAQVKKIIYDQTKTKGQIFEEVKRWLCTQPPITQYQFVRSQIDYKKKDEARNRGLDAMERTVSNEARQFNAKIRRIYDDQSISDRQTCEGVSSAIASTTEAIRKELNISPMNCPKIFEQLTR